MITREILSKTQMSEGDPPLGISRVINTQRIIVLRAPEGSIDSQEKLELIYVISNPVQARNNLYKIGRHKGGIQRLISRYSTAIPNVINYLTHPVEPYASKGIEREIHRKLERYRLVANGRTEWFQVSLKEIIATIFDVISTEEKVESEQELLASSEVLSLSKGPPDYIKEFIEECIENRLNSIVSRADVATQFMNWVKWHKYERECEGYFRKGALTKALEEKGYKIVNSAGYKYKNVALKNPWETTALEL